MWKTFLSTWNGRSFFLDTAVTPSPDLELYTDASGTVGFGGFFQGKWFQGKWPPHLQINKAQGISIEWQNYSQLWSLVPFGIRFSQANAYSSGATMNQS